MNRAGPRILTSIPGPNSRRYFQEEQQWIAPGLQSIALFSGLVLERGEGSLLTDVDGNTFIDFSAGVGVSSVGHTHPRYVAALHQQVDQLAVGSFTTTKRLELLKLLASLTPGQLNTTQLYSSGAEAVEAAIRLAKSYTKRYELLGFWGGFHGKTGGVLGLVGDEFKNELGPLTPGTYLAPYADCYRCPFQLTYPQCGLFCADFIRSVIKRQTTGCLAAIVIEPMQGTAGNVIPPPGYLAAVQQIAKEEGALLIADEMITGLGRTGKMFGCDHDQVVPDIITLGKGLGGGYPISALVSTAEITAAPPFSLPSGSSSSYGGNPLASAAALATIQIILDEHLVEHARLVGELMYKRLSGLIDKYPFVGEVRGKGLLIGIELVRDKKTKARLDERATSMVFKEALKRGLLLMAYTSTIRINPALTITPEIAETGVDILDEVFTAVSAALDQP